LTPILKLLKAWQSYLLKSIVGAFGKCCQTDWYRTVWNRPSVRKVVSDQSDRSAHFRTSADSDDGASSCYIPFSRSVWHRLLRLFALIDIKIERSVFGDRSKRPKSEFLNRPIRQTVHHTNTECLGKLHL
jgi:hypothetical protein